MFDPPHTFESVIHELRQGLSEGTVVLSRSSEQWQASRLRQRPEPKWSKNLPDLVRARAIWILFVCLSVLLLNLIISYLLRDLRPGMDFWSTVLSHLLAAGLTAGLLAVVWTYVFDRRHYKNLLHEAERVQELRRSLYQMQSRTKAAIEFKAPILITAETEDEVFPFVRDTVGELAVMGPASIRVVLADNLVIVAYFTVAPAALHARLLAEIERIKDRTTELDGSLEIESNSVGTNLVITAPATAERDRRPSPAAQKSGRRP